MRVHLYRLPVVAAWAALSVGCADTHLVTDLPEERRDASPPPVEDAGADAGEPDAAEPEQPEPEPDAGADAGADAQASMAEADDAVAESQEALPSQIDDLDCEQQLEDALDGLPENLACLGLYSSVRDKTIAPEYRFFAPAVPLWSDGSGKKRWIYLPPGEKIDASDENNWVFPVGTELFKEFRVHGRRIETRTYQKVREDRWVRATYEWDRDELSAVRSHGRDLEDVLIADTEYHVPTGRECDQCHGGREDRVLGFEAISLGLPGAQGLTLHRLVDEELIEPVPRRIEHSIGDDGSGVAPEVLSWLHINCGVSCHNDNQNAEAYSSGLRLKLRSYELDGRPPVGFEPVQSLVGATAKSKRYGEQVRVVPGEPDSSLMYWMITSREGPKDQMPPIASNVVDADNTALVRQWIRSLADEGTP